MTTRNVIEITYQDGRREVYQAWNDGVQWYDSPTDAEMDARILRRAAGVRYADVTTINRIARRYNA